MHYFHFSIFRCNMLSSFLDNVYIPYLTYNFRNFSIFSFLLEIVLLQDVFHCAYLWARTSAFLGKNITSFKHILMQFNFTATDKHFLHIQQYVSLAFNTFCVLLSHRCLSFKLLYGCWAGPCVSKGVMMKWNGAAETAVIWYLCWFCCFFLCLLSLCSWETTLINKYLTELHPIITTITTTLVTCEFNRTWAK